MYPTPNGRPALPPESEKSDPALNYLNQQFKIDFIKLIL